YQGIIRLMARQVATDAPHVSVIVLVYNELDSVEPLHRELVGVLEALGTSFEVLYVDDGSRDGSTEKLGQIASRDSRVRVVSFRRNFGQTAAVQAGIDNSSGEILVFLDGDMQNDPHDIPHLLEKIDEGYDVVSGWRHDRRDDITRVLPSQVANWIIAHVTGVHLSDFGCALKAYRRDVIQDVRLYGEMHRFIPIYASWAGARVTEIPVENHARTMGKSKYGISRTLKVVFDLMTIKFMASYQTKPIYIFGTFGMLAIALSFIAGIWATVLKFWKGVSFILTPLPLITIVMLAIGIQFLLMGLLAEMLVRTYHESQAKRIYAVREKIGFEKK